MKLLVVAALLAAGSIKGVFRNIQTKQFDKALQQIEQSVTENNELAVAYFAKSVLYTHTEFEKRNLDSAYFFLANAIVEYKRTPMKQKVKYEKKYKIRPSTFSKYKRDIEEKAFDETNWKDTVALHRYMEHYVSSPFTNEANMRILEIRYFSNMPADRPASFYAFLLKNFPRNPKINDAWTKYYEKVTWDGNYATLKRFQNKYPNFPFQSILQKELDIAHFAELHALVYAPKKEIDYTNHIEYIKKASNKYQAIRVLQMYIKPEVDKKDFDGALEKLNEFKSVFKHNRYYLNLAELLQNETEAVTAINIGDAINTEDAEHSPLLSADGNKIYFCGKERKDNLGMEDIFVSIKKDGIWQKAKLVPGINNQFKNEAPESISADGNFMFLFNDGDIFYSKLSSEGWNAPKPFRRVNTGNWDGDATIAGNGKVLFFASEGRERPSQNFAMRERDDYFDIYVTVLEENTGWSEPINLGPVVNTSFCDRYPYLHHDMKTLYFSSAGHGGFGSTDVFMTKRLSDTSWTQWSEPVNLGRFINTSSYDNGYKIAANGEHAYFAVHKDENFDIYYIPLPAEFRPEQSYVFTGTVMLSDQKPAEAQIKVENLETGETVGLYTSSPLDGTFTLALPAGVNYGFFIDKDDYYPLSENLDLRDKSDKDRSYEFVLHSIKELSEKNMSVRMNNIFFETNKYDLSEISQPELDRIAELINEYPSIKVSVEGHTDNTGNAEFNQILSQKRAEAVVEYLLAKGVSENKISAIGYGDTKPVDSNDTEEGKAKNRRVELRFGK